MSAIRFVDVELLRRRFDDWITEVGDNPPRGDEECVFSVVAFPRGERTAERGPGFAVEVTRASWRNAR